MTDERREYLIAITGLAYEIIDAAGNMDEANFSGNHVTADHQQGRLEDAVRELEVFILENVQHEEV